MVFPSLVVLVGMLAVLAYFARSKVTWTATKGTTGSVGMAFIVFIIFALIGWGLDIWLGWSVVTSYMYAVGGALQALAIVFWAGLALLILSMLSSARKVGTMVA